MRVEKSVLMTVFTGASLLLCLLVGEGAAQEAGESIKFRPEDPCSAEGGICGLGTACPVELRHPEKGLCPAQQGLGAECCYGVPDNIIVCRERGGDCVPESVCGRAPRDLKGECGLGEVCCIFL
ncbi:U-scoloptoxin(19)-Tl1a [Cherax quadricarinatus]